MRRFRFSIAGLLGIVLFLAVALAALRASTAAWDACLLGLALTVLPTAILRAVHRTDRKRAYWLGFGLFGWVYLIASLIPPVESRLPTTKGLAYLATMGSWPPPAGLPYFDYGSDGILDLSVAGGSSTSPGLVISTSGTPENFVRIGHSLLALALAFIGGHLSSKLYDKI
jgi:hypothetical protein